MKRLKPEFRYTSCSCFSMEYLFEFSNSMKPIKHYDSCDSLRVTVWHHPPTHQQTDISRSEVLCFCSALRCANVFIQCFERARHHLNSSMFRRLWWLHQDKLWQNKSLLCLELNWQYVPECRWVGIHIGRNAIVDALSMRMGSSQRCQLEWSDTVEKVRSNVTLWSAAVQCIFFAEWISYIYSQMF